MFEKLHTSFSYCNELAIHYVDGYKGKLNVEIYTFPTIVLYHYGSAPEEYEDEGNEKQLSEFIETKTSCKHVGNVTRTNIWHN